MAAEPNWTSLINFDHYPGSFISGKEGREVERIALESISETPTSYNLITKELFSELELLEKNQREHRFISWRK